MHEKDLGVGVLLDHYGELLTPRQREVMELYFNEDMSLFEISEHIGVTRQGVHDIVKRSEQFLSDMDKKLGLVDRFQKVESAKHFIEKAVLSLEAEEKEKNEILELLRSALSLLKQGE